MAENRAAPSTALEAAQSYLARGLAPIPVPHRKKGPTLPDWQHLRLTAGELPRYFSGTGNIGVLNGEPSGGLVDVDLDAPEAVNVADAFLPQTRCVFGRASKQRSHREYRCEPAPKTRPFKDCDGATLVELRSTGSQTVWPGSTHPFGETITFTDDGEPATVDAAALETAVARLAVCALLARHWPTAPGSRHDIANALAGFLLRGGVEEDTVIELVSLAARVAGDSEWRERISAARATARSLQADKRVTGGPTLAILIGEAVVTKLSEWLTLRPAASAATDTDDEHLTDLGNARRLVAAHGSDLRYCTSWKSWFVWDKTRWERDTRQAVVSFAKGTVRSLYDAGMAEPDLNKKRERLQHALNSERADRLTGMVKLAQSEPGIPVTPDQLDTDQWALNCLNGTLDLRTGKLREHRRGDLFTKRVPVAYDPTADCPLFRSFLDRIFADNADLIGFVQRAVGYSLTGNVGERVLFILHGDGQNGKTTLVEIVRCLLGDYAMQAPTEMLLVRREGGIPNDSARLRGARFVSASESEKDKRLAEAFVKSLTGGDTITARHLYTEWFDYRPEFKLWLATKHKPKVRSDDQAIWDRLRLIPFSVRITAPDRDFGQRLRGELSGILRWAVDGCLTWQRDGLGVPRAVADATSAYRAEMDKLAGFLTDRCVIAPTAWVTRPRLWAEYATWAQESGESSMKRTDFYDALRGRGFTEGEQRVSGKSARVFRGIGLQEDQQDGDTVAASQSVAGISGTSSYDARIKDFPENAATGCDSATRDAGSIADNAQTTPTIEITAPTGDSWEEVA